MRNWFQEARFGMFIHWGPYAVAGRGEWVLNRELIPYDEYIGKYVDAFHAEKFDPERWVHTAKLAGMKYIVLTTRHHDGFALWDTKTTDFQSVRMGPGRDIVREFTEAVRKHGLKVGLYYSMADWHHEDYPGAYERDWPKSWKDEESCRRFTEYYRMQLLELMSEYGKVDLLWYDGCFPVSPYGGGINQEIKKLQPDILINNRHGEPWDFQCCEQVIRPAKAGIAWEACMTLNDNWGYHAGDSNYKTAKQVVLLLTETASHGGNLLLNVGPKPDGTLPEQSERVLSEVGNWLEHNGEAIYNSDRSPYSWNNFGKITVKHNKVYIHLFHSTGEQLCLSEIQNRVLGVRLLAEDKALDYKQEGSRLFIYGLPQTLPDPIAITLVVEIEGEARAIF
jgi:alpha-L-fucosidase